MAEPIWMDFARCVWDAGNVLVSTDDDQHALGKKMWCEARNIRFVQVPKQSRYKRISTTEIRERIKA